MDYILQLLIMITIFSTLTMSLNYVSGYAGIMSLSHATFYGIGAYATAVLTASGHSFLASVGVGVVCAWILAWLASYPILKLKEDALILVSLGFSLIMFNVMLNMTSVTGGALGIKGIMRPEIFGISFANKWMFLGLAIVLLLITYFVLNRVVKSPYGVILKGIRENPTVAAVNGHNVKAYQRSAFVFSAGFAAAAGSLIATFLQFIEPKLFELMPSVFLLIMVILGGFANLKGSILGAGTLVLLPELLRFVRLPSSIIAESQLLIYGLVLVILMFKRPQGILGEYKI